VGYDLNVSARSPSEPIEGPEDVRLTAARATSDLAVEVARVLALSARDDEALEWLDRAADDGYAGVQVLRRDWAFAPLRHTLAMRTVMDRIRANAKG